MTDLYLHGNEIRTIFDLLGGKENDITYSVGWALAHSDIFTSQVLNDLFPQYDYGAISAIRLQEFKFGSNKQKDDKGYTDIEIEAERLQVVIEAKRGWSLPSERQLKKYAAHLKHHDRIKNAIVVMSECSHMYAKDRLPFSVMSVPVLYRSWKQLTNTVVKSETGSNHAEKRILQELKKYLEGLMSMQNQQSNRVFVVPLANDTPEWSKLSWIEIVTKKHRYFHPFGSGKWPKEPPNYIGFRYHGKLQSIHHVDEYEIVDDLSKYIPELSRREWMKSHALYGLGKPIVPVDEVKTGNIYGSGHVWAAIDLLLTCKTISEARDLTNKRNC